MLYEVITCRGDRENDQCRRLMRSPHGLGRLERNLSWSIRSSASALLANVPSRSIVITSYSIHYTKLYDALDGEFVTDRRAHGGKRDGSGIRVDPGAKVQDMLAVNVDFI